MPPHPPVSPSLDFSHGLQESIDLKTPKVKYLAKEELKQVDARCAWYENAIIGTDSWGGGCARIGWNVKTVSIQ